MARNRIKVRPIGFDKAAFGKNIPYEVRHNGEPFDKVQTIHIGNTVKNIKHGKGNKPRKGRTLAEMVYESFPV